MPLLPLGKVERVLRTLNNIIRTLLIHAHIPPPYWAEALATATYLLNRRPSSAVQNGIPFSLLYGLPPDYSHLRVFGCLCYPNMIATSRHKLAPRSTACVFLGYPSSHKGYRCLDLSTRRIIISRHIVFDESCFPFGLYSPRSYSSDMDFLLAGSAMPVRCTAATAPLAAAPSPVDVEHLLSRRAHLEESPDDPAILWRGPLVVPGPWRPPAATPAAPPAPAHAAAAPTAPVQLSSRPPAAFGRVYSRRARGDSPGLAAPPI